MQMFRTYAMPTRRCTKFQTLHLVIDVDILHMRAGMAMTLISAMMTTASF